MAAFTSCALQYSSTSSLQPLSHSSMQGQSEVKQIHRSKITPTEYRKRTNNPEGSHKTSKITSYQLAEEERKIRPEYPLEIKAHPPGAINMQTYRPIEEWTAWNIARRAAFAFFFVGSLLAAYLLVLNGFTNVFHLEGGLYTWIKEGLPSVSEEWS